jgi:general nucleoside transport system permease protein
MRDGVRASAVHRDSFVWELARAALVLLAIVGTTALLLLAGGYPVGGGLAALWRGSLGSWYAFTSATLVRAIPLMLTGVAVAVAFRAGVLNIGAEGQLLAGAAAATALALSLAGLPAPIVVLLALTGSAAGGAGWASIAAFLRARFAVLEVISTIMLNFLALQLLAFLVHGPLGDPKGIYPQSPSLPRQTWMPKLVPGTRLHFGFLIALAACAIAWFVRSQMAAGFRLRLAGANPDAAQIAGRVSVVRVTAMAFLVSGAIAGLGGAVEVTGVTYALYESISPGYGYTAIAVALLANLNPAGVVISGIGFGALEAGAAAMQRDAGVPAVVASVIEAAIILVLATSQGRGFFAGRRLSARDGVEAIP